VIESNGVKVEHENGPVRLSEGVRGRFWRDDVSLALLARERPQAACTNVAAAILTVDQHVLALDIRTEHAVGCTLGVTNVMPEHRALATDLTLSHDPPLFFDD
jgi:hypothetical protein